MQVAVSNSILLWPPGVKIVDDKNVAVGRPMIFAHMRVLGWEIRVTMRQNVGIFGRPQEASADDTRMRQN